MFDDESKGAAGVGDYYARPSDVDSRRDDGRRGASDKEMMGMQRVTTMAMWNGRHVRLCVHGGNRGGIGILVSSADVDDGDSGGVVDDGINAVKAAVLTNNEVVKANADGDNVFMCVTTRQATTTRTYLVMLLVMMLMLMKILDSEN
eukprot:scaffold30328_cov21-Prasinocladus_malaysianus.AAC.1